MAFGFGGQRPPVMPQRPGIGRFGGGLVPTGPGMGGTGFGGPIHTEPGIKAFKKGGKVKKTGLAKLHKGERVLTKKQAKAWKARKRGDTSAFVGGKEA